MTRPLHPSKATLFTLSVLPDTQPNLPAVRNWPWRITRLLVHRCPININYGLALLDYWTFYILCRLLQNFESDSFFQNFDLLFGIPRDGQAQQPSYMKHNVLSQNPNQPTDGLTDRPNYLLNQLNSGSKAANIYAAIKIFPAFYGTRRLITLFKASLHFSLSWATRPSSYHSIAFLQDPF